MKNKKILLLINVSFLFCLSLFSQKQTFFNNDESVEKWLSENNIPLLGIGVVEKGEIQSVKLYKGIVEAESISANTIFNVASLAKPVTAIVALKLISDGKWHLDKPLYEFWIDPDLKDHPYTKKLTTRHVLSHQSGFPNWRYSQKNSKLNFEFEPGTAYQYSGEGIEYLRRSLEVEFKKDLNELATELLFEPLQMNLTSYVWTETLGKLVVSGYNEKGVKYPIHENKSPNGADDLLTTIEDYSKFIISVMNFEGLSKKMSLELEKHQTESSKGKHFGLGFEIYNFKDGHYALSHGGSDKGANSIVFLFPKTKKGLVVFTNVDKGYVVYEKILNHYLGDYGKEIMEIEMSE